MLFNLVLGRFHGPLEVPAMNPLPPVVIAQLRLAGRRIRQERRQLRGAHLARCLADDFNRAVKGSLLLPLPERLIRPAPRPRPALEGFPDGHEKPRYLPAIGP